VAPLNVAVAALNVMPGGSKNSEFSAQVVEMTFDVSVAEEGWPEYATGSVEFWMTTCPW
jgi:hypothetical protein